MRFLLTCMLSLTAMQAVAQAPAPPPGQAQPEVTEREIVEVPAGATLLQEKSLPLDLQLNTVTSQADRGKVAKGGIADSTDVGRRGLRLYLFTLRPQETLVLNLKPFQSDKLVMSFAPPAQPDAMSDAIKRANTLPRPLRMSRIEVKNITAEPYPVVLRLLGTVGIPYKLEVTRK